MGPHSKDMPPNELLFLIPHVQRLGLRLLEKKDDNLMIEMPYNPELEAIASAMVHFQLVD